MFVVGAIEGCYPCFSVFVPCWECVEVCNAQAPLVFVYLLLRQTDNRELIDMLKFPTQLTDVNSDHPGDTSVHSLFVEFVILIYIYLTDKTITVTEKIYICDL